MTLDKLMSDDINTISRLTEAFARRFHTDHVLVKLISDWMLFVEQVETGYPSSIYEYTNELGGRNILESILQTVSSQGKLLISEAVLPIDKRFLSATTSLTRPIRQLPGREEHWWYYRVPKKLPEELSQDLISEGFLTIL
jgi:hypothetical protein